MCGHAYRDPRLTSAVIFNGSCYLFIDSRSLTITQNSHYDCLLLAIFLCNPLPLPFEVEIPDFYNIHLGVIRMQLFVCMVSAFIKCWGISPVQKNFLYRQIFDISISRIYEMTRINHYYHDQHYQQQNHHFLIRSIILLSFLYFIMLH